MGLAFGSAFMGFATSLRSDAGLGILNNNQKMLDNVSSAGAAGASGNWNPSVAFAANEQEKGLIVGTIQNGFTRQMASKEIESLEKMQEKEANKKLNFLV